MKRREFLGASAGFAGLMVPGLVVAQGRPCPPSTVGVDGGQSVTTACTPGDAETDWQNRSTAAGVFYRNNFSWKDGATASQETQPIAGTQDLLDSANYWTGTRSLVQLDTSRKLSGVGSMRFNMPANDPSIANYHVSFQGKGLRMTTPSQHIGVVKHSFYIQFAYYMDPVARDWAYGTGYGGKIAMLFAPYVGSFGSGEVVLNRQGPSPGGFLRGYALPGSHGGLNQFYGALSEYLHNGMLNRNTGEDISVGTNVERFNKLQRKHGPLHYNSGVGSDGNDPDIQHAPHMRMAEPYGGWMVFEIYVRLSQGGDGGTVKIWGAPYGQAPALFMGRMNPGLPEAGHRYSAGQLYTGFQLSNYHNYGQNGNFFPVQPSDSFVCYDEVICSDNPIPFPNPGGTPHSLPFPGTQTPVAEDGVTTYPWPGMRE